MLTLHGSHRRALRWQAGAPIPADTLWLDLVDPDTGEVTAAESFAGTRLPKRDDMAGIELSNRASTEGETLRLNVPFFAPNDEGPMTPLGIVLDAAHLVTLRYTDSPAFLAAGDEIAVNDVDGGVAAFLILIEAMVGRGADRMEGIAGNVGVLSGKVFTDTPHRTDALRAMLGEIGDAESKLTRVRLTMTGLLRILTYAHEHEMSWIDTSDLPRIHNAQKDLAALCEFDAQLTDKLQFLLDAVLGFINIDQNDVMKVLTVASVAAVPPVILVGVWGMNFTHMPELHWRFGYPLALIAIALSIALPVLWFRRRGWI